ncbi:MAG TPA: hypothetical protein EYP53_02830 [Candidatus Latescibacteria bacterium]|nr:hypothetical protein [Candidatus Latescibacterota bacterium]
MNARGNFHRLCRFEKGARPPRWETLGFWDETVRRWRREGLPEDKTPEEYFEMDRRDFLPMNSGFTRPPFLPPFEKETIKEDERTVVYRDEFGVIRRERKDDPQLSMPQWLEFPVKDRKDWEEIKSRLDPDSPGRYPDWEKLRQSFDNRNFPLCLTICGAYGTPRNLFGEERLAYMYYDDPDLITDIQNHWLWFYKRLCDHVLPNIELDYVLIWEDMAFKTAPLISPDLFKRFMLPYYEELIDHIKGYGVKWIMVDSDGDNRVLLPLFIQAGVNVFMPFEIAANMDPVSIRKEYGRNLVIFGGIDKRALSRGRAAIEEEVTSRVPYLLVTGGYIPGIDHSTPPDVSFDNYRYFVELVRDLVEKI